MKRRFEEHYEINPDQFKRYQLDKKDEEDLKMVEDMQKTVRELSKSCFSTCYKTPGRDFSRKDRNCVSECVDKKLLRVKTILNTTNEVENN